MFSFPLLLKMQSGQKNNCIPFLSQHKNWRIFVLGRYIRKFCDRQFLHREMRIHDHMTPYLLGGRCDRVGLLAVPWSYDTPRQMQAASLQVASPAPRLQCSSVDCHRTKKPGDHNGFQKHGHVPVVETESLAFHPPKILFKISNLFGRNEGKLPSQVGVYAEDPSNLD